MTRLVDIVNFNADASCLSASGWIAALEGGTNSMMYRWLQLYVENRRKVVLGFTGATIADLAAFNPEAVALVKGHSDVFEPILRPFSHDIALLRSPAGFAFNVDAGRRAVEKAFGGATGYFLPAEFMLTNAQVHHLATSGVTGTFVNASRFKNELKSRIPSSPYLVRGLFSARLRCIPVQGDLTEAYLRSLHLWDVVPWNQMLGDASSGVSFSWRDGESFLIVPDGLAREAAWLRGQAAEIDRAFLGEVEGALDFAEPSDDDPDVYRSYPVHSFSDWIKEFRMLGYLDRLATIERRLDGLDDDARALWLQAINSDVFSAVEKDSPVVALRTAPAGTPGTRDLSWVIRRSERGFEGEEFLELLDTGTRLRGDGLQEGARTAHLQKLRARTACLKSLFR